MMLENLREATGELHKELEQDNLANKIMDHSINLEEYKLLLYQNYLAYNTVENSIKKFLPNLSSDKALRLKRDLEHLGLQPGQETLGEQYKSNNLAEAVGAAYVIEGSAMGGLIIGREITNCECLRHLKTQEFFNGKRESIKSWNEFLKFLRTKNFEKKEIEIATAKAIETFELFGKSFQVALAKT